MPNMVLNVIRDLKDLFGSMEKMREILMKEKEREWRNFD